MRIEVASRHAAGLVLVVQAAAFVTGCAESQAETLIENTPQWRTGPTSPVRLLAEAIVGAPTCRSPYPLLEVKATVEMDDGGHLITPVHFNAQGQPAAAQGETAAGDEALDPLELSARANFGELGTNLQYTPPVDLLPFMGRPLEIEVSLRSNPKLRARLTVPPRYDCAQTVDLSGRGGRPGEDGEPGPHVRVAIGKLMGPGEQPLILVRVEDVYGIRARTLLSHAAPPLQLLLDGGAGGGKGGLKIRNVFGAVVARSEGPASQGGDGGSAEISYDGRFSDLQGRVQIINRGGSGDRPGRPGAIGRETPTSGEALFREEKAHGVRIYPTPSGSGAAPSGI